MGRGAAHVGRLTDKQRKFCQRAAVHGNLTRAAEEAGYADPNIYSQRLVKIPHVLAELERLTAKVLEKSDKRTIADAHEIQDFLTQLMRGELMEEELTLSGDVEQVKAKLSERQKAAMNLAKLLGLIKDKLEHGAPGDFERYRNMTQDELRAEIEKVKRG